MKKTLIASTIGLAFVATACTTTSTEKPVTLAAEAKAEMPVEKAEMATKAAEMPDKMEEKAEKDVKKDKKAKKKTKGLAKSFKASPEAVKKATIAAMQKNGFLLKDMSGMSIEGKRSNKIGLMVGSGGEKMYADIKEMADGMTEVRVRTKKTFVGIAGQKNWDDEVMDMISEALSN